MEACAALSAIVGCEVACTHGNHVRVALDGPPGHVSLDLGDAAAALRTHPVIFINEVSISPGLVLRNMTLPRIYY